MGRVFERFLDDARSVHTCRSCAVHLADEDDMISRSFQGELGRASLFQRAVNVYRGHVYERVLITGVHKVADIFCNGCADRMGWVYVEAPKNNRSQNYKTGKYLLEHLKTRLIENSAPPPCPAPFPSLQAKEEHGADTAA